jgi:ADP-ribosylglycohydrolase
MLDQKTSTNLQSRTTDKVKKTIYVVKPILVPVAAVKPRQLKKSQRQWCDYTKAFNQFPDVNLPE